MFGWKRRRARKAALRAQGGAHLRDEPDTVVEPDANAEPDAEPDTAAEASDPPGAGDVSAGSESDVVERPDGEAERVDGPEPGGVPESEPDVVTTKRPLVDLLTDGERLGFEPELHIPDDEAR